jgi:hypothetical protein
MAPNCGRSELKALTEACRCRGAILQNRPNDPFTRRFVMEIFYFHNASVPLFDLGFQIRVT